MAWFSNAYERDWWVWGNHNSNEICLSNWTVHSRQIYIYMYNAQVYTAYPCSHIKRIVLDEVKKKKKRRERGLAVEVCLSCLARIWAVMMRNVRRQKKKRKKIQWPRLPPDGHATRGWSYYMEDKTKANMSSPGTLPTRGRIFMMVVDEKSYPNISAIISIYEYDHSK